MWRVFFTAVALCCYGQCLLVGSKEPGELRAKATLQLELRPSSLSGGRFGDPSVTWQRHMFPAFAVGTAGSQQTRTFCLSFDPVPQQVLNICWTRQSRSEGAERTIKKEKKEKKVFFQRHWIKKYWLVFPSFQIWPFCLYHVLVILPFHE